MLIQEYWNVILVTDVTIFHYISIGFIPQQLSKTEANFPTIYSFVFVSSF